MILTILITIYILSFLRMYFWKKNAHNKNGIFDCLEPNLADFLITIIPVVNTVASLLVTFYSLNGKESNNESESLNFSKFFNVKN